jgi:hypothetical protein
MKTAHDVGENLMGIVNNSALPLEAINVDYLSNGQAELLVRDESTRTVFVVTVREIGA